MQSVADKIVSSRVLLRSLFAQLIIKLSEEGREPHESSFRSGGVIVPLSYVFSDSFSAFLRRGIHTGGMILNLLLRGA